jgi:hypothetical protein
MMISAAQIAASAVVLALAGGSGRNMLQTSRVADKIPSSIDSLLPGHVYSSQEDTVQYLQSLKRKDLLEIYASSRICSNLEEIQGEWNGVLLDNNNLLMTKVSNILTNVLFSMGRAWNGKAFGPGARGINRFYGRTGKSTPENEHSFDYAVEPSKILPEEESIRLRYSNYQSPISLWKTMVDEVRLLPGTDDVLIGMGSVAWGGGMLNASPFCLWRVNKDQ